MEIVKQAEEPNIFFLVIIQIFSWLMGILSYEALIEVGLFSLVFLIISWINFSPTEAVNIPPVFIPLLTRLGFNGSASYNTQDIKHFLSLVIIVLNLIGGVIYFFNKKILKIKLNISRWWNLGVILLFFTLSVVSCLVPTSKSGSESVILVLVMFLLFSFFSYGRYVVFQLLGNRISKLTELRNSSLVTTLN